MIGASCSARAFASARNFGARISAPVRPSLTPRCFATAKPALVRSEMSLSLQLGHGGHLRHHEAAHGARDVRRIAKQYLDAAVEQRDKNLVSRANRVQLADDKALPCACDTHPARHLQLGSRSPSTTLDLYKLSG
jgi:hypothetical protein